MVLHTYPQAEPSEEKTTGTNLSVHTSFDTNLEFESLLSLNSYVGTTSRAMVYGKVHSSPNGLYKESKPSQRPTPPTICSIHSNLNLV